MDTLYFAYSEKFSSQSAGEEFDYYRLNKHLLLIRTHLTQSQLYHHIKKLIQPESLIVGALDGDPKFKGMNEGSLKWLRS